MIQALSAYIKNIAMFMILTSFISIIVPEKKYKEYINLVLGFILIFLLIQPLSGILSNAENGILTASISLDKSIWQQKLDGGYYENLQTGQILEQYKEELTKQVNTLVDNQSAATNLCYNSSHFIIDESEEGFGEILSVTIYVEDAKPAAPTARPFIRVEKVTIDPIPFLSDKDKNEAERTDEEIPGMNLLKKSISDFYNISTANIHIRYK